MDLAQSRGTPCTLHDPADNPAGRPVIYSAVPRFCLALEREVAGSSRDERHLSLPLLVRCDASGREVACVSPRSVRVVQPPRDDIA